MGGKELRTVTSEDVLVDELRETHVDRRLSRTRRWLAVGLVLIVIVVLALEMGS